MRYYIILLGLALFQPVLAQQNSTAEERMLGDTTSFLSRTSLGGYGNVRYQRDMNLKESTVNLERLVLFVGHKFSNKISFFSELELEDAIVVGGEESGEFALEQCYIKFNVNPSHYLVAGLFLPRIGILNENHLPNTFNGNERTHVERYIIPSTWRELGIGFYGSLNNFPLLYSVGLMNGLNSAKFEHGSVIRGGRFEGRDATANNLALTGALQFYKNNFRAQVSGYYGGSVGLSPEQSDTVQLEGGIFGTPVIVGEADLQYEWRGLSARVLGSVVSIPDAFTINNAYGNNTPEMAYGAYAEVGYDILEPLKRSSNHQLILFLRYERLDMNSKIPENGVFDGTLDQQHIITGFSYLPINNVVIKADVRLLHTGEQNPDLVVEPDPSAAPYQVSNTFLNLGIGFSF